MRLHIVEAASCDTRPHRHGRARGFAVCVLGFLLLAGCGGHSGRRADGSCEADAPAPLMPTPLAFVSQYPFGSQFRSMTGIQHAFEADAARFEAIMQRERAKDPCAGGLVLAAVAVRPDGTVAGVQLLSDDTHPDPVGPLVTQEIRQMNFGSVAGAGYYTFQYPIRFNTAPAAARSARAG